jgi:uncharacterized membrane protein YphA (DoxX/SURF4 family)
MTIIALYSFQALIGILFLAAGFAKLTGMEFMSEPFALIGVGKSALIMMGSVEIAAGICLLFPRAGVVGAVLVATLTVGIAGTLAGYAITQGFNAQQPVGFQFQHTAARTARI